VSDPFADWFQLRPGRSQDDIVYSLSRMSWNAATKAAEQLCNLTASEIRLMAGEMTASEMRAVQAILMSRRAAIADLRAKPAQDLAK